MASTTFGACGLIGRPSLRSPLVKNRVLLSTECCWEPVVALSLGTENRASEGSGIRNCCPCRREKQTEVLRVRSWNKFTVKCGIYDSSYSVVYSPTVGN